MSQCSLKTSEKRTHIRRRPAVRGLFWHLPLFSSSSFSTFVETRPRTSVNRRFDRQGMAFCTKSCCCRGINSNSHIDVVDGCLFTKFWCETLISVDNVSKIDQKVHLVIEIFLGTGRAVGILKWCSIACSK